MTLHNAMAPHLKKSEITRARLMQAALTVFHEKGFANAQIKDIVRCAGKSIGVFYRYFDSKSALLDALIDDFGDEQHWYRDAETGLLLTTQRLFVMQRFWESYIRHGTLLRSLHQAAANDQHFQDRLDDLRANGLKAVTQAVRAGWPVAPRSTLHPELVAEMVTKVMEHSAAYWSLNAPKLQISGLTEADAFQTLVRLVDVMMLPDTAGFKDVPLRAYDENGKRAGGKR